MDPREPASTCLRHTFYLRSYRPLAASISSRRSDGHRGSSRCRRFLLRSGFRQGLARTLTGEYVCSPATPFRALRRLPLESGNSPRDWLASRRSTVICEASPVPGGLAARKPATVVVFWSTSRFLAHTRPPENECLLPWRGKLDSFSPDKLKRVIKSSPSR